jgi:cholesterol transport system auxiliary component
VKRLWTACLLLTCLLSTGCEVLTRPKPEPTRALLTEVPEKLPRERTHDATLIVLPLETSPAYDTTRMAYTVRPYEISYFRDNEWVETPAQMFDELLVSTLRDTGYFKVVLTSPAAEGASFRLQATVLELLQDHTANPPVLRLALRIQLFGAAGEAIGGRDIRRDQPLLEPTPYAGVVAANNATALALRDAAQFVLDAVRKPGTRSGSIFRSVASRNTK